MRIAIFAESFLPKWDGVTTTTCHLLDHLALRGHASLMFAPEGAPDCYADTRIIGLPSFSFPFYPELRLASPIADQVVEEAMAAFQPDLIHVINPAVLAFAALKQAEAMDLPVVASYHTDIPGYAERYGMPLLRDPLWAYLRWLHNRADLNLCPSDFTRQELESHDFERVRVWSHGVDAERFSPRHRREDWRARLTGGHPDAPLLLYVGRLATEKRVDWIHPVLDAVPEARLAIVGDGPKREELEALFADTPTVFTGYLRGQDLSHAYAAADLFCFPSANETFGNVVLEAMASGLPVIAPASGGPVDHVHDGRNGFLFDPDDIDDMVGLTRWLVSYPAYLEHLSEQARAYAESQRWEAVMDGLLADYASVIEGPRRAAPSLKERATAWMMNLRDPS
jgi:glycosyltransferase involved in cell wall biosynthesis